jgi:hypothetical protein
MKHRNLGRGLPCLMFAMASLPISTLAPAQTLPPRPRGHSLRQQRSSLVPTVGAVSLMRTALHTMHFAL